MHRSWKRAGQVFCLGVLLAWASPRASAQDFFSGFTGGANCCQKFHCPPALKHCLERPPHIHWSCGCPKPICNPCNLPNWGYYQTCWTPYPWNHNWSHCPVPPPAALVNPGLPNDGYVGPGRQGQPDPGSPLPTPRVLERPGL